MNLSSSKKCKLSDYTFSCGRCYKDVLGNTSRKSVDHCSEKSVMCPTDIDGRVSIPNRDTA